MPELAEVAFFRKQWNPGLGHIVQGVRTHSKARIFRETPAALVERELTGSRLIASAAHGKQLCFQFSGDRFLGLHLGMSGRLLTAPAEFVPAKHDHLVLRLPDLALVFSDYRMFGKVLFHRQGEALNPDGRGALPSWWTDLPPQPQEEEFTLDHFKTILKRRPRAAMKALLLDQKPFPGIGNWMADEILWRARIHPNTRPEQLTARQRNQLFKRVKEVTEDAIRVIGTDWSDPPDRWLFNHRWKRDGICPASGKPLAHISVGGRTSCYSPAIQKEKH